MDLVLMDPVVLGDGHDPIFGQESPIMQIKRNHPKIEAQLFVVYVKNSAFPKSNGIGTSVIRFDPHVSASDVSPIWALRL